MTGMELDRRLRKILSAVTPETVLSSAAALVKLGFGARQSFKMCEDILRMRKETSDAKRN